MLQRRFRGLLATLVLCAIIPAWAQDTGVMTGTVTDSSGAVVVNAQVTAVNVATNFETATVTNAEGLYRIPFLRPGTYRVRIAASGFKTFVRDGLELRVGATMPINAVMELGACCRVRPGDSRGSAARNRDLHHRHHRRRRILPAHAALPAPLPRRPLPHARA